MRPEETPRPAPRRQLSLFDSTCIIVGIIIGAGIFETTPIIAANVANTNWLISVWLIGGLLALSGASCYAELATAYPYEGGNYVYLTRAFGRRSGFLFAWVEFWIVRPGSIGAMAYVLARYAIPLISLESERFNRIAIAGGCVVALTAIHVAGVSFGKWTQNVLTVVKVVGLLVVVLVGMLIVAPPESSANMSGSDATGNLSLAMILVMFTLGGWNEMAYVAAEVRNPDKNLMRSMVLGTFFVTIIYILVVSAMVRALGLDGVAQSQAVAADVLEVGIGPSGAMAIRALICISCLSAVNGMIFTGARIFYAVGTEHRSLTWLGRWEPRTGTPPRSLVLQGIAALTFIVAFGSYEDRFTRLVMFTAPFFWFFLMLTGFALFVLRWSDPTTARPYRVWMYPFTPAVFCFSSLIMMLKSGQHAWNEFSVQFTADDYSGAAILIGAGLVLIVGIGLSFYGPENVDD